MRVRIVLLALVLMLLPLTGCTRLVVIVQPATKVGDLKEVSLLTALGDSVPYGTACRCIPYPRLTAADISHVARDAVKSKNDAVPGYTSSNVVTQLDHNTFVIRHIQHSQAVLLEIGANDVAHSAACKNDVACYDRRLPGLRQNLDAIVARIHKLTTAHPATLILLDYWNVWLGGKYAAAHGPAYVNVSHDLTARVSTLIRSVARSHGGYWIDLRTAFRGPNDSYDETHLLAPDGDHPNRAGHIRVEEAIAKTLSLHA